jgi:hypothetical protein
LISHFAGDISATKLIIEACNKKQAQCRANSHSPVSDVIPGTELSKKKRQVRKGITGSVQSEFAITLPCRYFENKRGEYKSEAAETLTGEAELALTDCW